MNNVKKPLNEGYQPKEERGYQPKPDGQFGYQPANDGTNPPSPPQSDTIVSSTKKK